MMVELRLGGLSRAGQWAGALVGFMALGVGAGAHGQALERNLPPPPKASEAPIETPALPGSINDDHALGAQLSSIVLLGSTSPVPSAAAGPGVDASAVERLNRPRAVAVLKPFLGRPISRKLIADIETAIVREYRRQGFPFVEVSTPEQEITGGVLQIRVVEFRVGKVKTPHARGGDGAYIESQVRTGPGDEIDVTRLGQDLDWLNRYPGRTVQPSFSPGGALGETDLNLDTTYMRPWSVNAGYANSGSPLTGVDRYFLGGSFGGHFLTDFSGALQVTGSPDFWTAQNNPQYESVAGRVQFATAPRQDVELTVDAVESNEPAFLGPFPLVIRQQTLEATLGYRSALSNLLPLPGDIVGGIEMSRQSRNAFSGDLSLFYDVVDVYQLFGEWTYAWGDRLGATSVDVSVHGSPGGLDAGNTSAAFLNASARPGIRATYVYGTATVGRQTRLPFGFSLLTQFNGQYAGQPLPSSQQIALGGQTAVRGYSLDDGAWDDGFVLRNTLSSPLLQNGPGRFIPGLQGRIFADYGFGRDEAFRFNASVASVGAGADLHIGRYAVAGVDISCPLIDAPTTRAGDIHIDGRLTLTY
jgi:hemolysin activation/secretion protein